MNWFKVWNLPFLLELKLTDRGQCQEKVWGLFILQVVDPHRAPSVLFDFCGLRCWWMEVLCNLRDVMFSCLEGRPQPVSFSFSSNFVLSSVLVASLMFLYKLFCFPFCPFQRYNAKKKKKKALPSGRLLVEVSHVSKQQTGSLPAAGHCSAADPALSASTRRITFLQWSVWSQCYYREPLSSYKAFKCPFQF